MKTDRNYMELTYLKGRMAERRRTYREMSERCGMSLNSFSDKINGHTLFNIRQALAICGELDIALEEIPRFFLCGYAGSDCADAEKTAGA